MARPIFCGNFEYDARQSDLERLFRRYGRVERVDMKSGFAFIYMEDERDADDAIRALDRIEFGRKGRKLRVEWTKDREVRKPVASRRSSGNTKPSKTLFVINFDPYQTRKRDLERHFESYGKIVSVRIRRNFAFVQYDSQEDASRALDATNMSKLMGRVLSVEYAVRDDDDDGRRNGYSPDRSRDRSPGRRGHDRRRSPSPYRRERDSPDYGRGPSPGPYRRERGSPDYGRRGSPSPYRRERPSPEYARGTSRSRSRSHSPSRRDRAGSDHGLASRHSPYEKERRSYEKERRSPYQKERRSYEKERRTHEKERRSYEKERGKPENDRTPSPAPYRRERSSPDNGRSSSRSPRKREGASPENGLGRSQSPYELEKVSPENGGGNSSRSMPEAHNSHDYAEEDSPMQQRYDSRSPPAE